MKELQLSFKRCKPYEKCVILLISHIEIGRLNWFIINWWLYIEKGNQYFMFWTTQNTNFNRIIWLKHFIINNWILKIKKEWQIWNLYRHGYWQNLQRNRNWSWMSFQNDRCSVSWSGPKNTRKKCIIAIYK